MKIAIIDIIGIPYDGSTVFNQGLGGSESAVTLVSRELAKLDFDVTVFNNCNIDHAKPGKYDGVLYRPLTDLQYDHTFDIVISSRTVIPFTDPQHYHLLNDNRCEPYKNLNLYDRILSKAKQRILWMHDTFCLGDTLIEDLTVDNRITDIFTLSDFHLSYVTNCWHGGKRRNFEVLKRKVFITRNGVNLYKTEVDIKAKDPDLFVYNASVTKGMIPLVENIWPEVKKHCPNAKLKVIGGYYRFSTSDAPDEQELKWHNLANDPRNNMMGIEFTGIIRQREIAEILEKSSYMIYPSAFPETFGISTLESLCYNTPVITCRFGALEEIALEGACYLIDYAIEPNGLFPEINKNAQIGNFIRTVVEAYHNKYLHQQKQYYCNIVKEVAGWDTVALQWKQFFFNKNEKYLPVDEYRRVTALNHKLNKIWKRRFHNVVELEYHRVSKEQPIAVVSTFYNCADYIERCIESVAAQDYDNYRHILIDDASTDNTVEVLVNKIRSLPTEIQNKFTVIVNTENQGAVRNQVEIIRSLPDDSIVMLLDGDDSLITDNSIFAYYNSIYHEDVEFTYGSCWSMVDKIPLISQPYPESVKKEKGYRQHHFNWILPYTHFRTFKKYLMNELTNDLFQNDEGKWYKAGGDGSVFYALIEAADPAKVRCLQDVVYNYNDMSPLNDYKVNSTEQNVNANNIVQKRQISDSKKKVTHDKYSFVVPTMWRCNNIFLPFLDELCSCDLVDEIIIINNDNDRTPDYDFSNPKIKMADFGRNTFVNPAWNYGVKVSQNDRICIVNDDISYDLKVLEKIYDMLTPEAGIFGLCPGVSDFDQIPVTDKSIDIVEWTGQHTYGFGCLMWIHKKSWIDIPAGLDIYFGDNFIFDIQLRQGKKNYIVANLEFYSKFAVTTIDTSITGGFLDREAIVYDNVKENMESYIPKIEEPKMEVEQNMVENIQSININLDEPIIRDVRVTTPTIKKRILIGIPTAKNIEVETFKSIYDQIIPEGYEVTFQYFFGYQIDQVRNLIADWVVKGYDYLFSVDSDIAFPSDTLMRLLSHNVDVVSGLYIQRKPGTHILEIYQDTAQGGVSNMPYEFLKNRGLTEVAGCGFGCVLVKGDVFRKIGYPQFQYFSAIDHNNTISEDVDFCRKARVNGFKIYADPSIKCNHIGQSTFVVDDNITAVAKPVTTASSVDDRLRYLANQRMLPKDHVNYLHTIKNQFGFEPRVIYDIGACVLHWTTEASMVWPTAEIVAFEAMSSAEFIYKERGIKYQIGAMSHSNGLEIDFYQNEHDPGGNSYYRENIEFSPMAHQLYNESHIKKLKTITLDTSVKINSFPLPDLIKMDVQGAELDVLRGATNTLQSAKHVILELQHVEYNKGAPHCDAVIQYMNDIGFDFVTEFCPGNVDGDFHFVRRM